MKIKSHILIILLFAVHSLFAQVDFGARVSAKKLGVNQRLRIEFSMNQEGDNFNPPSFSGFEILAGPSSSVSHSWANGKRSFSKVYSYVLTPDKKGNLSIGKASIEIAGKTYYTKPIQINVSAPITPPKNANDPDYIASQNIHLITEISKANPYINEGITLVHKLYVHPSININDFNNVSQPSFSDFWSKDVSPAKYKIERGEYNGSSYNYVILKQTILYPQISGKIKIEPYVLDVVVNIPTNKRNMYGQKLYQSVNQKVSSSTRIITVKDLPESGKPKDFSGAVGNFEFDVTINRTSLKAEESLELIVQAKGNGNLKLFQLPKLIVPSSLEVYEPEHKEQIKTTFSGMRGAIKDVYTIIPQFKGSYPINEISFSYFNPKTQKYVTVESVSHNVEVLTGPVNNSTLNSAQNNTKSKQIVVTDDNQFRSFKTMSKFSSIKKYQFFRTSLFWCLLLLPLLLLPVMYIVIKVRENSKKDIRGNKLRSADKLAKKFLSKAKINLNDKSNFYESLHKSLHNYLKAKLEIETSEFSVEKIQKIFAKNKIESETTTAFIQLIENCNIARFTPISSVTMQQDYDKAVAVINEIDKVL